MKIFRWLLLYLTVPVVAHATPFLATYPPNPIEGVDVFPYADTATAFASPVTMTANVSMVEIRVAPISYYASDTLTAYSQSQYIYVASSTTPGKNYTVVKPGETFQYFCYKPTTTKYLYLAAADPTVNTSTSHTWINIIRYQYRENPQK